MEIDYRTITAAEDWSYSFGTLPADDGYGNTYTYTIREDGVEGYYSRVNGFDLTNTPITPDTPKNPDNPDEPTKPDEEVPTRKTPTPRPHFEAFTEEEMTEMFEILDYGTPLWGTLLGTGDQTPVYPYVFGGLGFASLIAFALASRKRRKDS